MALLRRLSCKRHRAYSPAVAVLIKHQRRNNTPYMPWPFDKYSRPGSAKHWLSKYPTTDASQDEYEQEFVYLDELDARIKNTQTNYAPSERWQDAYNEYGWYEDRPITETYGDIGGAEPSASTVQKYGRGNKIDVSHYIQPRYYKHARVLLPSPYIHPDLRKRMGPLKNLLSLPPEEPSIFKLWNPWNMAAGCGIIMLSKEYFLIGHDFWHAMLFWGAWSFIVSVGIDWWTWWYALRGQEMYDQDYFPLNDRTEKLFAQIDKLGNRPNLAMSFGALATYMIDLSNRCVDKDKKDMVSAAHIESQEKLSVKFKEESGVKAQTLNNFKETSFKEAMAIFGSPEEQKKYLDATMKMIAGKAELKPGVTEVKTDSNAFETRYKALFAKVETEYYANQRKAGTLPWALATDKEIEARRMSPADKQKRYADQIQTFSKKYHEVPVKPVFA